MKKILLISGSNRNGNTNYILNKIKQRIENTELILLSERDIKYCKGCLACHKVPSCVIKDDIQEITNKMLESDLVIFGIPNYFDNVTGLFKNFVDRIHPLYKSELAKGKKVIFIFTGGGDAKGTLEEMDKAVIGMVQYLKLNKLKSYSFKVLDPTDIQEQQEKVEKMIDEISEIL